MLIFGRFLVWEGVLKHFKAVNSIQQVQKDPGGTPWNFWWGCAARISKSTPNFRPKKCLFPHPFLDLASKMHTRFQT